MEKTEIRLREKVYKFGKILTFGRIKISIDKMCSKLIAKSHEPWSYQSLPEFSMAIKELDQIKEELFTEIGDVFFQFEQNQDFGLILLHKHFVLGDEEVLVQSSNANSSVSIPWSKISGKMNKNKLNINCNK